MRREWREWNWAASEASVFRGGRGGEDFVDCEVLAGALLVYYLYMNSPLENAFGLLELLGLRSVSRRLDVGGGNVI